MATNIPTPCPFAIRWSHLEAGRAWKQPGSKLQPCVFTLEYRLANRASPFEASVIYLPPRVLTAYSDHSHHRISNDRAVHLLRVNYGDQRNHKPRIFNSGGPSGEPCCPHHGTLCLCAKHGFGDRERGAISNRVN